MSGKQKQGELLIFLTNHIRKIENLSCIQKRFITQKMRTKICIVVLRSLVETMLHHELKNKIYPKNTPKKESNKVHPINE